MINLSAVFFPLFTSRANALSQLMANMEADYVA